MKLNKKDTKKLFERMKKGLKNPVGPVSTPKIHMAENMIRNNNKYELPKIKRKIDMFSKTNNIEYLKKANYLIIEILKNRGE